MNSPATPHVLRVVEIKPSEVAVMEGIDVARIKEQIKNIAHNLPPILDHNTYPEGFYQGPSVHCQVCGTRRRASKMVFCDKCYHGYRLWCLDKQLLKVWMGEMDASTSHMDATWMQTKQ